MKNKGLIATIVVLIAVIITLVAVLFLMQMPTILSSDGLPGNFLNKKETTIISSVETTEKEVEEINETTVETLKLSAKVENYTGHKNHVSIDYPQITGMADIELQNRINNKIKTNALSIVPLYPISTAVQNLTISCEVKLLNEDYVTVIYQGKVVGVKAESNSSSDYSSNDNSNVKSNRNNSNANDPYLDGFVDPLAGYNNMTMPTTQIAIPNYNYQVPTTASKGVEIIHNSNANTTLPNINNSGTADKGPTPVDIKSPTAVPQRSFAIENTATNNPNGYSAPIITNNYSSSGTYYSQSGTQNIAPSEYSSANSVTYSLPVYGFVNTNASDINQKIYYTNTVDMRTGQDVKLGDFVKDFETLSKYLRSSKVEFENISENDRKAVREYINKTIQSKYIEQMNNADFRNSSLRTWPKIFSYKDIDGTIYFSVKLSSKLGNYAIVKYKN